MKMRCDTCGNYISWEHGGILCEQCRSLYCCDTDCIPEKYLRHEVGRSQAICSCPKCEKKEMSAAS
jgi:hypothetical protein